MAKRYPLACIFLSFLTIISGIMLLITASIFTSEVGPFRGGWPQLFGLSVFSIIIGAFAIICPIGLIYTAYRQFPTMLLSVSISVLFVTIMALVCGIVLITGRVDFQERAYNRVETLFRNYSDSDLVLSSKGFVADVQQTFQCCGYEMATDWKDILNGTNTPDSCCINAYVGCGKGALIKQNIIYLRGCGEPVGIRFQKRYIILIAMNFTVVGLTLLTGVLGLVFERVIRQEYELM